MTNKIAIGSDHGGYDLKESIKKYFDDNKLEYTDFGVLTSDPIDYPIIAKKVANAVASGDYDKGLILCGSGLGVAITANKIKGIRAVTCHDIYSAKMSRAHNDANILTMGGRCIDNDLANEIVDTWLNTPFEGGRHEKRVNMIEE